MVRQIRICIVCGALALCGAVDVLSADERNSRLNVLFILVDDFGWADVGFNGSTFYETPNLDRLAQRGVFFTNGYAACPVCSPTRASILTGKYPARLGITTYIDPRGGNQPGNWRRDTQLLPTRYLDHLPLEEVTLAEAFREHGYQTFFAGKWHLGSAGFYPEDQGFAINRGGFEGGSPPSYFSPYRNPRLQDGPPGEHLPARLAEETVQFITDHREQPFFAYLSFYSVHVPLVSRDDLREKFESKQAAQPSAEEVWGAEGKSKLRRVQNHPVYAGMVAAMDQAVGRVLTALDELKLADRTAIVFMSDNGGLATAEGHPTSNRPLRAGKGWIYEGGIREPMLIVWPQGGQAGVRCEQPVTSTDFYPTLLEMAELPSKPDQHLDGVSLVPLLRGQSLERGPLYWHFPHYGNQGGWPASAVRDGPWKLVFRHETRDYELYNLDEDLGEKRDLWGEAAAAEVGVRLKTQLGAWLTEIGAEMPSENFRPDQTQLPTPPPEGAAVLFDGGNTAGGADHLFVSMAGGQINWPIEDGALVSTQAAGNINHLCSRLHFRDADIHVEFQLPDQGECNSGIYLHGNYELQILNSHQAQELTQQEMGSLYGFAAPLVNAARPPGEWQVYDIRYRAPRRDAAGKIEIEGSVVAYLNGQLVQDGTRFGEPRSTFHPFRHGTTDYLRTIYAEQKKTGMGPLFLQDHNAPVRFRNIWVRQLDDQFFLYEPPQGK